MNEGMAMYLQGVWQGEQTGFSTEAVMDGYALFEADLRAENGPPGDYDPTTFGTSNVYYGPALMWDQLRRRIGEERFDEVTRAWPAAGAPSATREEYLDWLVEQTGVERAFFDEWLLSPTTPDRE
jgi:aminopeptidase N